MEKTVVGNIKNWWSDHVRLIAYIVFSMITLSAILPEIVPTMKIPTYALITGLSFLVLLAIEHIFSIERQNQTSVRVFENDNEAVEEIKKYIREKNQRMSK